jgi:hypothetical protein
LLKYWLKRRADKRWYTDWRSGRFFRGGMCHVRAIIISPKEWVGCCYDTLFVTRGFGGDLRKCWLLTYYARLLGTLLEWQTSNLELFDSLIEKQSGLENKVDIWSWRRTRICVAFKSSPENDSSTKSCPGEEQIREASHFDGPAYRYYLIRNGECSVIIIVSKLHEIPRPDVVCRSGVRFGVLVSAVTKLSFPDYSYSCILYIGF